MCFIFSSHCSCMVSISNIDLNYCRVGEIKFFSRISLTFLLNSTISFLREPERRSESREIVLRNFWALMKLSVSFIFNFFIVILNLHNAPSRFFSSFLHAFLLRRPNLHSLLFDNKYSLRHLLFPVRQISLLSS